jgi:hypothetical protein
MQSCTSYIFDVPKPTGDHIVFNDMVSIISDRQQWPTFPLPRGVEALPVGAGTRSAFFCTKIHWRNSMRSSQDPKAPNDSGKHDALFEELCVLQACAWGVYHIGQYRYDPDASGYENMACALLREFDRIMDMFEGSGECK